ncbi:MAG: hypothetical protein ACOC56_02810 [Atribacterota bacterium]
MTLKELKEMEEVKSEKDYWKKHKIFKKTLGGVYSNIKRFIGDPKGATDHFKEVLKEGVRIKVITEDYAKKKEKEFYERLSKPNKFKTKAKRKLKKAIPKIKKKIGWNKKKAKKKKEEKRKE